MLISSASTLRIMSFKEFILSVLEPPDLTASSNFNSMNPLNTLMAKKQIIQIKYNFFLSLRINHHPEIVIHSTLTATALITRGSSRRFSRPSGDLSASGSSRCSCICRWRLYVRRRSYCFKGSLYALTRFNISIFRSLHTVYHIVKSFRSLRYTLSIHIDCSGTLYLATELEVILLSLLTKVAI